MLIKSRMALVQINYIRDEKLLDIREDLTFFVWVISPSYPKKIVLTFYVICFLLYSLGHTEVSCMNFQHVIASIYYKLAIPNL